MPIDINSLSPALRQLVVKDGKVDEAKLSEIANAEGPYAANLVHEAAALLSGDSAWGSFDEFVYSSPQTGMNLDEINSLNARKETNDRAMMLANPPKGYEVKEYRAINHPDYEFLYTYVNKDGVTLVESLEGGWLCEKYYQKGELTKIIYPTTEYNISRNDDGTKKVNFKNIAFDSSANFHQPDYVGESTFSNKGLLLSQDLGADGEAWHHKRTFQYDNNGMLKSIITAYNYHYAGEGHIFEGSRYLVVQQDIRYNPETSEYEEVSKKVLGTSESADYEKSGLQKVSNIQTNEYEGWEIGDDYYDFSSLTVPRNNKDLERINWW